MSLALIQEAAKEVRRLAIAGSTLAVGDFRLKKLIAPLEQAGAKVPVFGQVAKSISDLVNGTEADSAAQLLTLSTLLNAILYTQGESSTAAAYEEFEVLPTTCRSTRTSARVLKPLVQALTSSGGGRFEVIKSALERKAFNDLRLIDPAIKALDDNFPELAELVAEQILPEYGPGIVPRLKERLDLKGKKADGRRLKIMHRLDRAATVELCKTVLDDGSPEVKAYAIECLGQHEEHLPLVMEQANSKNKVVRAAALEALAEHDRPEIVKLFDEAIKGKALDILARPFRAIRNQQVLNSLLGEGKRVFELLVKGDEEQIPRYCEILDCLLERKDADDFLLNCFNQSDKLAKVKAAKNSHISGADVVSRLTCTLYRSGSPEALAAILEKRESLPPGVFGQVVRAALRLWPADKVFKEFSPLLAHKKGAGKEKADELQRISWASTTGEVPDLDYLAGGEPESDEGRTLKEVKWDPRWVDAGIKADQPMIVYCLANSTNKGAIPYLLKLLDAKNTYTQSGLVIQALARCGYPGVTDAFLSTVEKKTKNARYFDYNLQLLFESARVLPKTDLPKLEALAPKLDEKFVDKYLEALEPLRPARQPESA